VRDEARIEDVVAKVRAAAGQAGLSEAIAETVWRTLIERSIAYEFGVWDALRQRA
jgi:isochorismate pyruvate lyase